MAQWGGGIGRRPQQPAMQRPAGGVNVPNYYQGSFSSPDYYTGNYQAGNMMTGNYQAGNAMTGNYGSRDFYKGFQNIGSGASYIDMPNVKGGKHYMGGVFLPGQGKQYFNDKTIDLVDKAGNYAGLEAEASRLLGRSGGALAASMGASGFNGGLANLQNVGLQSQVIGGLAEKIEGNKLQREQSIQEGTLTRQQALAAADAQLSQLEMQKQQAIMQGDHSKAGMILQAQQAIMQGDISRAGMDLQYRAGRTQNSQFNAGQNLQRDSIRQNTMNFNAGNRLAADQTRQGTAQFNAGQRFQRDQARTQNAQYNAGNALHVADQKTNAFLQGENLWNNRLGMTAGMMQNPAMGYVDPVTGRPSAQMPAPTGPNPYPGPHPWKRDGPGFFAPGGGPFGLW